MKRGKPLARKKPMRRGKPLRAKGKTKYARRPRNLPWMRMVKTLPCAVSDLEPWAIMTLPSTCSGEVQADHAGERSGWRKCPDEETIPMCRKHHRQRTNPHGVFAGWMPPEMRRWCDHVIEATQPVVVAKLRQTGQAASIPRAIAVKMGRAA